MIPRVLEPEVMESQEESIAYDDMDHQLVNQQFVTDLLATERAAGEVLDMGTGTARIPMLLCEQCDSVRVLAIDLSTNMLDMASMNIHSASLLDRIMLDRADSKELPYEDQRFDVVISNSLIHHLPSPKLAIEQAIRVCRPGGLLFFRDLLRPESERQLLELCELHVADATDHGKKLFSESLRASLTLEELGEILSGLGYSESDVQQTSDRHWTWSTTKPN